MRKNLTQNEKLTVLELKQKSSGMPYIFFPNRNNEFHFDITPYHIGTDKQGETARTWF